MKICITQTQAFKGDIERNIDKHKNWIKLAISYNADAIFFPELSLTGYEPDLANQLATDKDDSRFNVFQELSNANKISIGVGIPAKTKAGINISMVIFQPNQTTKIYSKQHLHADELPFFIEGDSQLIVIVGDAKIAPAICYESLLMEHADQAAKLGAEIYLASVAKSKIGVEKVNQHYPEVARKHALPVLMSNCVGYCDKFESSGNSAIWNSKGLLLEQLDDKNEGALIFDTKTEIISKLKL